MHLFVYVYMSEAGRIGSHLERTMQDTDLGGVGNHYVILLENLDKGLSALSVAEFIHRETSISPQVYVFPNLTSEPSTQGALVLDCEKKFRKLSDFLDDPNHIIMSSRERYAYALFQAFQHLISCSSLLFFPCILLYTLKLLNAFGQFVDNNLPQPHHHCRFIALFYFLVIVLFGLLLFSFNHKRELVFLTNSLSSGHG